jgi:hypothetical protein
MIWIRNKFRRSLRKRIFQEKEEPSNVNGSSNFKRNGIFRARLVAYGYSQIPGIDFSESFTPIINNTSFEIMLIAILI